MNGDRRTDGPELDALAGVARVARVLVGSGELSELSSDAMAEIRDALGFDVTALYLADKSLPGLLRCVGQWSLPSSTVGVAGAVVLDPAARQFVAASGGPLVFRERTGWVMDNPFEPQMDNWVVLPLVSERQILGVVVGCSTRPITLSPIAVMRFTVIGDLLSAGTANTNLRAEIQRTALQRERIRLAEELHDDLAQDLAAAVRELALLQTRPSADVGRASQDRLREAVLDAHRVVRSHLNALMGDVEAIGLRGGLEELCAKFRRRGLAVTVTGPAPDEVLEPARVVVVLRVLNESLTNIHRHAGVTKATVSLTSDGSTITLSVVDRGTGFDAASAGATGGGQHGLTIMRERAQAGGGTLSVRSRPGEGTTVELSLPTLAARG